MKEVLGALEVSLGDRFSLAIGHRDVVRPNTIDRQSTGEQV